MIIAVIPARIRSKRIPKKNIKFFNGRPIISYSIEAAISSKLFDKVIVSTDDDEIADVSKNYGAEVVRRPPELATDNVNLLPVNQHVLKILEDDANFPYCVVSLQPTSPLLKSSSVNEALKLQKTTDCDSVSSIGIVKHNHPYWTKSMDPVTKRINNFTEIDGDKYLQKQDLPICYSYTGGFYIRKSEIIRTGVGKGLGTDSRGFVVSDKEALDIDYPIDLEFFRYLMR